MPRLNFTTLTIGPDCDQLLNTHKPLVAQAKQDSEDQNNGAILAKAVGTAKTAIYNEIRRQGILYTNEETAAFDRINVMHETTKQYAKQVDQFLSEVEGMDELNDRRWKAIKDTCDKMYLDSKGFVDEFGDIRSGLTEHQGFRGDLMAGNREKLSNEVLGERNTKELNKQFLDYRGPMIKASADINNSEVKMKEHCKRMKDSIAQMLKAKERLEGIGESKEEAIEKLTKFEQEVSTTLSDLEADSSKVGFKAVLSQAQKSLDAIKPYQKDLNPKKVSANKFQYTLETSTKWADMIQKKTIPHYLNLIKGWRSQIKTCEKKYAIAQKEGAPYSKDNTVKQALSSMKSNLKTMNSKVDDGIKIVKKLDKEVGKFVDKDLKKAQQVNV
ncbi:Hypothetical protein PBC10988_24980 [Planctomycetales bacterium 10988]|nr:Hypothetical protein PBC10988_24980 [Planctomycetales bacterium 10988]